MAIAFRGVMMLASLGAVLALPGAIRAAPPAAPPGGTLVPTVAVLYFDYEGQDPTLAALRKGLARMLISDLGDSPSWTVVERDRLEDLLKEQDLGRSGRVDAATAARAGRLLGARFVVVGGYFDLAGTLRADARLVEVATGRVVASHGASGALAAFGDLERSLARDLAATLAGRLPARVPGAPRVRPVAPKKLSASTAARFGRALDQADQGRRDEARKELEAVLAEQPDFGLAQGELAQLAR